MTSAFRIVGALVAAIAVVFLLLIAVEFFSSIVHPLPADFDNSMEQMCQHVARYPHWVLAAVVPMWAVIAFLGTTIARRLGNRPCAIVIAVLLLAAAIGNIAMLPYPMWFKIVQPVAILIATLPGVRRKPSQSPPQNVAEQ